jgi:acylphosphatase
MSLQAASRTQRRASVRVTGTVQGVGFRPYIYRLASELSLSGYVLNDSRGVLLEVEGVGEAVSELLARLKDEAPPLSVVEQIVVEERELAGSSGFEIRSSTAGGTLDAPVTADSGTCARCLAELFDPRDRRFRYPFINCTNCGPRLSPVWSGRQAVGVRWAPSGGHERSRSGEAGRNCARRWSDRRGQGDRRLPPGLPRRR